MEPATRKTIFTGRRISLEVATYRLEDGSQIEREIVRTRNAVVILPVLGGNKLCMIRNYRHPVGENLLELPAGVCEPNEDPAATAARELAEETGFRAQRITKLCEFFSSPGILDERLILFAAEGLEPGNQQLEHGEQIEVQITPWADAVEMIRDGRIADAKTIIGILFWALMRPGS